MSSRGKCSIIILLVSVVLTRNAVGFQFSQHTAGRKTLSGSTPAHINLNNGGATTASQLALHVGRPYSSYGGIPPSFNHGNIQRGHVMGDNANAPYASTSSSTTATGSPTMAVMISQENKRILIEELGYKRADVKRLKFDVALELVAKRFKCPNGGPPDSWCVVVESSSPSPQQQVLAGREQNNNNSRMMMQRRPLLEPENKPEHKPPVRQTVTRRWSSNDARGRPGMGDSGAFSIM